MHTVGPPFVGGPRFFGVDRARRLTQEEAVFEPPMNAD
jgi:hypothetical protein